MKIAAHSIPLFILFLLIAIVEAKELRENPKLDAKVKAFLNSGVRWRDMNIPTSDGQLLYDLIIKGGYTKALEIGTSTGHSAIWMAWALSKTGGKLITIEIDESRHQTALENFARAGLSDYIDARLADAHTLVRQLDGPFDFVFSDADKDWYKQYFIDIDPKLIIGGCFTAHNISVGRRGRGGQSGTREFIEYVQSLSNYETTIDSRGGGVSISYKKAE
ncbi:methyltransferase domain-containing protein [candidate division KSB1 bacterium]|nr:class I SAM-dependent methyltransferase [candidate division KSB1 bacterium]RQW00008.1 MAG: methyltransferase domain-containing protein [candidate division KSB1 bacterium]